MRAKKSLGQHFLNDPSIIAEIIDALKPLPEEKVLEIGPGRGALTVPLLNTGAQVTAVELDRVLAPEMAAELERFGNFKIFEADILRFDPAALGLKRFAVVGNLPYNITTPVMDWLFKYNDRISRAILMMQKEVAERVISPPGRKSRSTLSVLTELYFDSRMVIKVPPESFDPPPQVHSAVVLLTHHGHDFGIKGAERFRKFVRNCFAAKRKSLLNNLNSAYPLPRQVLEKIINDNLEKAGIRAEQLSLQDFIKLSQKIFEIL